jgi:hypothetical protein
MGSKAFKVPSIKEAEDLAPAQLQLSEFRPQRPYFMSWVAREASYIADVP